MRVLFHAINGIGLGHLARTTTLAIEVRALGHDVLVLTSALDTSLLQKAALDFVRLPPRLSEPHVSPERSLLSLDKRLEHKAIQAILEVFFPDIVVFDTHPPPWLVHHVRSIGARATLVLRELRPQYLDHLLQGDLLRRFDRILIPHERTEVDEHLFPWFLPISLEGPVLRPMNTQPASPPTGRPLLVVAAGGGGQPVETRRFFQAAADAHWLLRNKFPTIETALIQGPYGCTPKRIPPGVRLLGALPDPSPWLLAADLVISQAGYNTIQEIRALKVPAVLVPGHRRAEDQSKRARRLARSGAAVISRAEAGQLADTIGDLLQKPERIIALRAAHSPPPPRNREAARWLVRAPAVSLPPRILLIAHHYPPRIGGMETTAYHLARGLVRQGHHVTVYTQSRLALRKEEGVDLRAIYTQREPPKTLDLWPDLLLTIAAAERDQPDLIHLCNAGLAPWIPWLHAALERPVTINVHGNDLLSPWTHHDLEKQTLQQITAQGLSEAEEIIAVSQFSASLVTPACGTPKVILGGVDSDFFSPGKQPRKPWILTISRLVPRKGHKAILRALPTVLQKYPEARFVFTGEGELQLSELWCLARSLGVEHAMIPMGYVDRETLRDLYRSATVFALITQEDPSDVEGFGLVLLEAAACGLPSVVSCSGGAKEAASYVGGVLVSPDDSEELAQIFLRIFSQSTVVNSPPEDLARTFSWEKNAREYSTLFSSIHSIYNSKKIQKYPLPDLSVTETNTEAIRALCSALDSTSLREVSRDFAASMWAERQARRKRFSQTISAGKIVKLRATGTGKYRLAEAIEDCIRLGHLPALETKLSIFLDPIFFTETLRHISELHLLHFIPSTIHTRLITRLTNLSPTQLPSRRSLQISSENPEDPEAIHQGSELEHACRSLGILLKRTWERWLAHPKRLKLFVQCILEPSWSRLRAMPLFHSYTFKSTSLTQNFADK